MSRVHRQKLLVVKDSTDDLTCELVVAPGAACSSCRGCNGRSTGHASGAISLATFGMENPVAPGFKKNPPSPSVGQTVDVEAPGTMLLALSSVVYLSPVLHMLFFIVCSDLLFSASEAGVALSAVVGLGLGFGTTFIFRPALRFYILRRLTVRSNYNNPR